MIDCSNVGTRIDITRMDRITKMTSEAKFILIVEKFTVFMKLVDSKFTRTYLVL